MKASHRRMPRALRDAGASIEAAAAELFGDAFVERLMSGEFDGLALTEILNRARDAHTAQPNRDGGEQ